VVFFEYPPVSRIVSVWCCAVGAAQRGSRSCGVAAGAQKLRQRKERGKVEPGASSEDVASAGRLARLAQAEVRGEAALLETTPEKTVAGRVGGRATEQRPMV